MRHIGASGYRGNTQTPGTPTQPVRDIPSGCIASDRLRANARTARSVNRVSLAPPAQDSGYRYTIAAILYMRTGGDRMCDGRRNRSSSSCRFAATETMKMGAQGAKYFRTSRITAGYYLPDRFIVAAPRRYDRPQLTRRVSSSYYGAAIQGSRIYLAAPVAGLSVILPAGVVELVDTGDLKSPGLVKLCRFKSGLRQCKMFLEKDLSIFGC